MEKSLELKTKKETIIRTIVAAVTMTNYILTATGKNPLPWSETELYEILSAAAAVISEIWVWWKNNSFTKPAIKADIYLKDLKDRFLS